MPTVHLVTGAFVAPLAPAAGLGAGALITILAWLICFTLAYIWRRSFGAMLQWIADEIDRVRLPAFAGGGHILGPVSSAFRYVDNAVEGALVYAANATEHGAVWLFHETAARFDQVGREIGGLAYDVSRWGSHLIHVTVPRQIATAQRIAAHRLEAVRARLTVAIRAEAHAWRLGVHKLTVAVEHEYNVLGRRVGRVGTRVGRLERTVERELGRLSRVEKLLGAAVFAGLVVKALERLGLRWLRCGNVAKVGRRLCGMDAGLLDTLLLDALALASIASVVEFAEDLRAIEDEAVAVMGRLVREWPDPLPG